MQTSSPLGLVLAGGAQLPDRRRLVRGPAAALVALRVPRGPAAGADRAAGAALPARERAVAGEPRARRALGPARAVRTGHEARRPSAGCSWPPSRFSDWWACNAFVPLLGGTLAAHEAQRLGLSPPAGAGAGGGVEGARLQRFQPRRPGRRARGHPARPAARPAADVRRVLPVLGARAVRNLRTRARAADPPDAAFSRRRRGLRHLRRLHLLSPGAVPGAPARHGGRLLLQHRARARRGRTAGRRLGDFGRPAARASP